MPLIGKPDRKHISTSFAERQNLTMRMNMRGFTRPLQSRKGCQGKLFVTFAPRPSCDIDSPRMANSKGRRKLKRLLREQGLSMPQKVPSIPQSPQPSIKWWKRIPRRTYALVVVFGLAITLFEGYPSLSLHEGGFLQPNNGLSEMWILQNDGYIPITNLDATCAFDAHFSSSHDTVMFDMHNGSFSYANFAEYLGHGGTVTLPCFQGTDIDDQVHLTTGSNLTVAIGYAFYHLNFAVLRPTQKFHFVSIVGPDRVQHWVHR
jgi:hypothetical protein